MTEGFEDNFRKLSEYDKSAKGTINITLEGLTLEEEIEVVLTDDQKKKAHYLSDLEGKCNIKVIPGTYTVSVKNEGFKNKRKVTVEGNSEYNIRFKYVEPAHIQLTRDLAEIRRKHAQTLELFIYGSGNRKPEIEIKDEKGEINRTVPDRCSSDEYSWYDTILSGVYEVTVRTEKGDQTKTVNIRDFDKKELNFYFEKEK